MSEAYDVNFCFAVPRRIENERIALTPFIPTHHATLFMSQAKLFPDMFTYLPFGPFESEVDFVRLIETRVGPDPGYILFCVWDKTAASKDAMSTTDSAGVENGAFAGIIGLLNSSLHALATEIGFVMILPPFHRTHVASNATGLLLHYALELGPSSVDGQKAPADVFNLTDGTPLGLRRVYWQTNAHNAASRRLAERMGFKFEATLRWDRAKDPRIYWVNPEDKMTQFPRFYHAVHVPDWPFLPPNFPQAPSGGHFYHPISSGFRFFGFYEFWGSKFHFFLPLPPLHTSYAPSPTE